MEDKLVFPDSKPLENVKAMRDAIVDERNRRKTKAKACAATTPAKVTAPYGAWRPKIRTVR